MSSGVRCDAALSGEPWSGPILDASFVNVWPEAAAHGVMAGSFHKPPLEPLALLGDPYAAAPVCRGASMAFGRTEFDPVCFNDIYPSASIPALHSCRDADDDIHCSPGLWVGYCAALEEFTQPARPQRLPQDPLFQLSATTLSVYADSPASLGNDLLQFLRTDLGVQTMKLRCLKFTAKAHVSRAEGNCTVKFRMYDMGSGAFAVELQRRQGDAIVFMGIFRQLARFLSLRYKFKEELQMQDPLPTLPTSLAENVAIAVH